MVKRTTVVAVHTKPEERSDSKFKGVRKRKWGRWVSEIRLPNSRERIWLGSYDSAEKAARAFDAALFCLRGTTARFNFPDNPPKISGGQSLSPPEIQVAAEKFAKSGGHPERQPEPSEPEPEPERQHPVGSPSHSPSPSLSEGSSVTDVSLDGSFLDLLTSTGSGDGEPDLGMFPGLDEFPSDFYGMPFPSTECSGEENIDELLAQDNFLWSF